MNQYTGPARLLRDIDVGHVDLIRAFYNLTGSGTACFMNKCASHFWRSLLRDLRVDLQRDFVVLPHCFGPNGVRIETLLVLLLVEFDDEWFDSWSKEPELACVVAFPSVEKAVSSGVTISCLSEKFKVKFLWVDEKLQWIWVDLSFVWSWVLDVLVESDFCSPLIDQTESFSWIFVVSLKEMKGTLFECSKY